MREGRLQTVSNWLIDVASHDWGNEQPQITGTNDTGRPLRLHICAG